MNSKVWCSLLAISTLFLAFAFSIFQYEPPLSLAINGVNFLGLFSTKYRVRVIVEYSIGYLEGRQFHPASGVAVTLIDSLYTSSSGEAVFFVPPGFHQISVEAPFGLMLPWNDIILIQRNTTVKVRFDFERIRFERISVNANLIQDASTLELQFKVPIANVTYVGTPFIVCWSSEGRWQIVSEGFPFPSPFPSEWMLSRRVEPGIRDIYVMNISGIAILYVFPESSYMPMGLIFVTIEGE